MQTCLLQLRVRQYPSIIDLRYAVMDLRSHRYRVDYQDRVVNLRDSFTKASIRSCNMYWPYLFITFLSSTWQGNRVTQTYSQFPRLAYSPDVVELYHKQAKCQDDAVPTDMYNCSCLTAFPHYKSMFRSNCIWLTVLTSRKRFQDLNIGSLVTQGKRRQLSVHHHQMIFLS